MSRPERSASRNSFILRCRISYLSGAAQNCVARRLCSPRVYFFLKFPYLLLSGAPETVWPEFSARPKILPIGRFHICYFRIPTQIRTAHRRAVPAILPIFALPHFRFSDVDPNTNDPSPICSRNSGFLYFSIFLYSRFNQN